MFSPLAEFQEQEWLLKGRAVRHVIADRENRTCPIFAPDPRWMALHKLWLAQNPERNALKRSKALDIDFVLSLPEELRTLFDEWARKRGLTPA